MTSPTARSLLVGLVLLAAPALGACSQVQAIAPVGGDRLALVRFAGNDVLAEQGVAVATYPVCRQDASAVTCTGTTLTGDPIVFSEPAATPLVLTVTVAGRSLYSGSAQAVVDRVSRPT